jgi:hypothetical protein
MQQIDIPSLARLGAQQRYQEIEAELASLRKHFPDLGGAVEVRKKAKRGRPAKSKRATNGHTIGQSLGGVVPVTVTQEPVRKKRTMSAKARKAIAAAQKARWAKHNAEKAALAAAATTKGGKKKGKLTADAAAQ